MEALRIGRGQLSMANMEGGGLCKVSWVVGR